MKAVALTFATLLLSSNTYADNTFYGDFLVGNTKQSLESTTEWESKFSYERETNSLPTKNSTSFGARLGYQFTDNFALELGHVNFGDISHINDADEDYTFSEKLKTKANLFAIKGNLPISDKLSLNATFGLAKWKLSLNSTLDYISDDIIVLTIDDEIAMEGDSYSDELDGTDTFFGLGLQYELTETIHLGLEYTMIEIGISEKEVNANSTITHKGSYDINSLSIVLGIKI